MPRIWERILSGVGLGATPEERLDQAAEQMQKDVQIRRELAARTVALARSKQRELGEAVSRYRQLEAAAVELQRQGRGDVVSYVAVEMASLKSQIETLTTETEQLNSSASETVEHFRQEKDEAEKLLNRHGQLRAVAQMNRQLEALQRDMKALAGASTARGAFRAVAGEIEVKALEFRATAELESGGATRKAEVARALTAVETQKILQGIQIKALAPSSDVIEAEIIDRATAALASDPIHGILALPAASSTVQPEEPDQASDSLEEKE
jgi:phage shock protein A